jgi:hypothetical protein
LALEHILSSTLLIMAGITPSIEDIKQNKQLSVFPGHRLFEGKGHAYSFPVKSIKNPAQVGA